MTQPKEDRRQSQTVEDCSRKHAEEQLRCDKKHSVLYKWIIVGVATTLLSTSAWAIINERRLSTLEANRKNDKETMHRIEEMVKEIRDTMHGQKALTKAVSRTTIE